MSTPTVKAFISYCWSSDLHQEWVLALAERLQLNGVHVVIDVWDLKAGQDVNSFMETMVTDVEVTKVLVICDKGYRTKANERKGGVGSEAQIISPELYARAGQTKFIPVVAERDADGEACLPVFLKGRLYVDLASADSFGEGFVDLMHNLFGSPKRRRPPLGPPPAFLTQGVDAGAHAGVLAQTARFQFQLPQVSERARPVFRDLLDESFKDLMSICPPPDMTEAALLEVALSIPERATVVRDAILDAIGQVARADLKLDLGSLLHEFFERCIGLLYPGPTVSAWNELAFEPQRFVVQELFLCALATLIRHDRFDDLDFILDEPYFYSSSRRQRTGSFCEFREYLGLYDNRLNAQQTQRLISFSTALMKDRLPRTTVSLEEFMMADFVAMLRWALDPADRSNERWFASSLVYRNRNSEPFDLFYRARTDRYFAKVKRLLKVDSRHALAVRFAEGTKRYRLDDLRFGHIRIEYEQLLNLTVIAGR